MTISLSHRVGGHNCSALIVVVLKIKRWEMSIMMKRSEVTAFLGNNGMVVCRKLFMTGIVFFKIID
jgi:hypothetical protein